MIGLLLAMLEEGYSDRTATSNVGGGYSDRTATTMLRRVTVIGLLLAMLEEGSNVTYSDRTATSNVGGGLQ